MNGFYAAYMTGKGGVSTLLFAIKDGVVVGVDMGGMKYDGRVEVAEPSKEWRFSVEYLIPPGVSLITGGSVATPTRVPLEFSLPANFANGQVVRIDTPLGPVNAKVERLRDFE